MKWLIDRSDTSSKYLKFSTTPIEPDIAKRYNIPKDTCNTYKDGGLKKQYL